jgi:hypothetical protein
MAHSASEQGESCCRYRARIFPIREFLAVSIRARYLLFLLMSALLLGARWCNRVQDTSANPETMDEVIAIAGKLGLHYRGDLFSDSGGNRIIVSEHPMTWEGANALRVRVADHPDWLGKVAVYHRGNRDMTFIVLADEHMVPWGRFFLYGDRTLITKLMWAGR